jgi:hypothetical protein
MKLFFADIPINLVHIVAAIASDDSGDSSLYRPNNKEAPHNGASLLQHSV